MDDFKDFFKDLRDRITSPLFGSFIVSWFLTNWNLVFILIFNNADTLKKDRYQLIYTAFTTQPTFKLLWLPALGMLFYVIFYPWIKNYIKLYHAKRQAENDSQILDATKGYSIPLENYIEQLNAFEEEKKGLSDLIAEQIKIREERNLAINDLTKLTHEKSILEGSNADLTKRFVESKARGKEVLEGNWNVKTTHFNGSVSSQFWIISGSIIVIDGAYNKFEEFVISTDGTEIAFAAKPDDNSSASFTMFLRLEDDSWHSTWIQLAREVVFKRV